MADDNKIRTSGFCKFNDIRIGECYKYNNDPGLKYCRFENEDSAYKHYLSHWKEGHDLWPAIPNGEHRWFYSWPLGVGLERLRLPSWTPAPTIADLEAELIPRWDYVPTGPYPHDDNDFDVYDYVVQEVESFPPAPYYAIIVKDYLENGESETKYFAFDSESKWKAGMEQLFEEEDVTGRVYGYHVDRVAKVKMVIE